MGNSVVADRPRSVPPDDVSLSEDSVPQATVSQVVQSQVAEPAQRPMNIPPMNVDFVPHFIEREVMRTLTSEPGLAVSNLVVRRVQNGVCLSGVVETCDDDVDVCGLARQVEGVEQVLNRLLVRSTSVT